MDQFLSTEIYIVELLLVVSAVAIAVRRLRVPYTVVLVVVGLLIAIQRPPNIQLRPEVILALFVPPLVFEAAFHLNLRQLWVSLPRILLLAVPGVILTMLIVGGMVALVAPLPLASALVFGALIAATDPVAVVALFRALGVPRRLAVLVEGESLLNDGTAIVLFNLVLAAALTGRFSLLQGAADFLRVAAGGAFVGCVLGWLISQAIARLDDYLIETTLTTILAFGSYLVAEQLHFSGVLAVVVAGLINGNLGPRGMSPSTRIVLFNFWEYVAFLANSLVFLLIGLQVDVNALLGQWQIILAAIVAVLVARAAVVYGLDWLANRSPRFGEPVLPAWQHVLTWGGLRGAISLALALSLPAGLGANAGLLRQMTFGVVLFTLVVQGTTMRPLLRRLRLIARSPTQVEYELRHARLAAVQSARRYLDQMYRQGQLSSHSWEVLKAEWDNRSAALADRLHEMVQADPALAAKELDIARRELLRTQRGALLGLRRDGVIADDVYEQLTAEIDAVLVGERMSRASGVTAASPGIEPDAAAAGDDLEALSPGSDPES